MITAIAAIPISLLSDLLGDVVADRRTDEDACNNLEIHWLPSFHDLGHEEVRLGDLVSVVFVGQQFEGGLDHQPGQVGVDRVRCVDPERG